MTVVLPAPHGAKDVGLAPAATAMVWVGVGRPHEAVAVPGVTLGPDEVLVEIELATVCGSDVHTVRGHRCAPSPLVLGHESVGRVVALGAAGARTADGRPLGLGDRVVWSVMASCGGCDRCRRGLPQKCRQLLKYGHERIATRWELTGGFATHAHLRSGTAIIRVGERLDARVLAPLGCGTATAWAAVDRADRIVDVDGAAVLVTGAGLVGLAAAAIAADRGGIVVVADPDPARRELALRFGATATIDPADTAALAAALSRIGRAELDILIEASGSVRAVEAALASAGVGAVIVLVGSVSPTEPVAVDPESVVRRLLTIRGVHNYGPHDLLAAAEFLRRRGSAYPFAELVSVTYPLHRLDEAIAAAGDGGPVRIGIVPLRPAR